MKPEGLAITRVDWNACKMQCSHAFHVTFADLVAATDACALLIGVDLAANQTTPGQLRDDLAEGHGIEAALLGSGKLRRRLTAEEKNKLLQSIAWVYGTTASVALLAPTARLDTGSAEANEAFEIYAQLTACLCSVGLTTDDVKIARSLCTLLASRAACEPSTPTLASDWAVTPKDQLMGEETPERYLELSTRTPPRPAQASQNLFNK